MDHIETNQLSRIGLGAFNMSAGNAEHCRAFKYAIQAGCNLVDTAPNYMNGKSEELIGNYLHNNPKKALFVVTKAGYVSAKDLSYLKKRSPNNFIASQVVQYDDIIHCIHPDFLKYKINGSLRRLNRSYLDGFLLHNPEYFLHANTSKNKEKELYKRIGAAFEFLEEYVSKGKIRYYGISSNTFPLSGFKTNAISLENVIKTARQLSSDHHFRLIQFPYNIVENNASLKNGKKESFLETARNNKITTFSNRPLNLHDPKDGFIRLAYYEESELSPEEAERAENTFARFLEVVNLQLKKNGLPGNALDFEIIDQLNENWKNIGNQASVNILFYDYLRPFLNLLYHNSIPLNSFISDNMPAKEKRIINTLYKYCIRFAEITMTKKCKILVQRLIDKGIFKSNDTRPIPLKACEYYLSAGIDHVLVGLRSKKYVDDLKALF